MDFKNSNFSAQLAKPPKARRKMEICFGWIFVEKCILALNR
jgi:hypothetical protein